MANPNVKVSLTADASKLVGGFKSAEAAARVMERELLKVERAERALGVMQLQAAREMESSFAKRKAATLGLASSAGKAGVLFGAALAGGLALSARAAEQWESAFAGVKKVVDGTPEQIAVLGDELRDLAKRLPVTAVELAGVAEAAGQLGVAREDIAKFTQTAVELGVSTNLSAEDAATGLAKLGTIMGTTNDQVDRAGAALVALGNNGASTEADILSLAQRLAGAGRQVGLTEAQVLGFANALSSVGIEAEAGGTAFSRVFLTIDQAARQGGKSLDAFSAVAGVSSEAFRKAYATDAAGAVTKFVAGLGQIQKTGGDVAGTLAALGLGEIRVRDSLLRTAASSDALTDSVALGSKAWQENSALVQEANRRFETSESKIKVARNQLNDVAIDIGSKVLPAFAALAKDVGTAAEIFGDLPGPVKEGVAVLGVLGAVIGLVGGGALIAVPKLVAFKVALSEMGPLGQKASAGLSRFGGFLTGPVGIGITAGLAVATVALGVWAKKHIEARQQVDDLTAAIKADSGAIGENTRAKAVDILASDKVYDAARRMRVNLQDVTDASLGNAAAQARVNEQISTFVNAQQKASGNARVFAADATKIRSAIGGQNDALAEAVQNNKDYAAAMGGTAKVSTNASRAQEAAARSAAILATDQASAAEEAKHLKDALSTLNDGALDARQAIRDYQKSLDDATEASKAAAKAGHGHRVSLDASTEAGRKNQEALDGVARAAQAQADAILDETGSEGKFRASLATSRADLIKMATRFGLTKTEARKYADTVLAIPSEAITTVTIKGVDAARDKIAGLAADIRRSSGLQAGIFQSTHDQQVPVKPPGHAGGGAVFAGRPYIVGEVRPELFVPETNGRIVPSVPSGYSGTSGGSGNSVTYNIVAPDGRASTIAAAVRRADTMRAGVGAR